MDIALVCLRRAGEVCLPAVHAYGDHCAKVAWTTAFASLSKAGCGHVDALATHSVVVATTGEVAATHRQMRKVSNAFVQDFWGPHGIAAAMESLRAAQALKKKGKAPMDVPESDKRGATDGDKV